MIRVVLVDDHALVRAGVRAELESADADTGIEVVAEAGDVGEAVDEIVRAKPDVVVCDVHLPGGNAPAVIRGVIDRGVTVKFLALSVSDAAEDVIEVIRTGARGYVTKTIDGPELVDAIRRVNEGDAVFSPRLAGFVLDAFSADLDSPVDPELDQLTAREQEVMRLLAEATPTRRSPADSRSRSRPSKPCIVRCSASSNCRVATNSPAGLPTAASSEQEHTWCQAPCAAPVCWVVSGRGSVDHGTSH